MLYVCLLPPGNYTRRTKTIIKKDYVNVNPNSPIKAPKHFEVKPFMMLFIEGIICKHCSNVTNYKIVQVRQNIINLTLYQKFNNC